MPKRGRTPLSDLDAILEATELDIGGQLCTTTRQYVSGMRDNVTVSQCWIGGLRTRKAKVAV